MLSFRKNFFKLTSLLQFLKKSSDFELETYYQFFKIVKKFPRVS